MTSFRWGTVTSISPVRIQLDGDTAAIPVTLDSLIDPLTLAVSERTLVEIAGSKRIVHGKLGGVSVTVPDASTTVKGISEHATDAETIAGIEPALVVTTTGLKAALTEPVFGVIPSSVAVGSGSATVAADGTVTFTGCTSVSLNDVFDGLGADIYEAVLHVSSVSTGLMPSFRFRVDGVDNTASIYDSQILFGSITAVSAQTYTNENSLELAAGGRDRHLGTLKLFAPALVLRSGYMSNVLSVDNGGSRSLLMGRAGFHDVLSAFTGFTLTATAGNMTGTIKVVKIA